MGHDLTQVFTGSLWLLSGKRITGGEDRGRQARGEMLVAGEEMKNGPILFMMAEQQTDCLGEEQNQGALQNLRGIRRQSG